MRARHTVETSKLRKVFFSEINQSEITDLLGDLREMILRGLSKLLEFRETLNICDEDYYNLTALSYAQFEDVVNRHVLN